MTDVLFGFVGCVFCCCCIFYIYIFVVFPSLSFAIFFSTWDKKKKLKMKILLKCFFSEKKELCLWENVVNGQSQWNSEVFCYEKNENSEQSSGTMSQHAALYLSLLILWHWVGSLLYNMYCTPAGFRSICVIFFWNFYNENYNFCYKIGGKDGRGWLFVGFVCCCFSSFLLFRIISFSRERKLN